MRRESHKTEAQSLALAAVLLAVAPSFSLAWAQHPSSRSTPSRTPSSAPHAQSQPHGNSSAGFSHPGSQLGRGPGGAPEHSPAQPSLATPFGNGAGRGPFVGGQPGPGAQPGAPRTGDHGPGAVSTQPWGGQPQSYRTPTESSTLGAWMEQHRNMPVHEQERQLKADPSFNRLNSGTQQRLLQQLHQMNAMSPEQQQRRAARVEMLERLTPQERMQVNMSQKRWAALPYDRQQMVRHAFHDLGSVPPDQRQTVLNSSRYLGAFSPEEREILSDLLRVEPYRQPMP